MPECWELKPPTDLEKEKGRKQRSFLQVIILIFCVFRTFR